MTGRSSRFGSVRKLPSGRYQARYTHDGADLKAPRTFGTKQLADQWLRLRQAELDSGARILARPATGRTITLAAYAAGWVDGRQLKPRTHVLYRQQLERYLLPTFGSLPLAAITVEAVREWFDEFAAGPTVRGHAYSLLKAVLGSAMLEDPPLIDRNPCRVRGGSATTRRHRIRPATPAEIATIVENMPDRLRAAVLIAAWGGLRFGEITELRRGDIDGQVVHVARAVVRLPGDDPDTILGRRKPRFVVGTPKSEAGIRSVTLPAAIMPAIDDHLAAMNDTRSTALLFPADSGEHLAVSTLNRYWYPARAAAGRPDLRWHDLRHTQAVYAAQAGATLAELMARLGHSTPTAALRYQHAADGRDQIIAAALSALAMRGS